MNTLRMLRKLPLLLILFALLALPFIAGAAVIINDTFQDANTQNQNLANNSLRVFNGRAGTVRTDASGSVTFDVTNAGGSEGFWAYFTDEAPVTLDVGDRLSVSAALPVGDASGFRQRSYDGRSRAGVLYPASRCRRHVHQHGLAVIVKAIPRDGHKVCPAFDIEQPVVAVGKIAVVDPDMMRRILDINRIVRGIGEEQIANAEPALNSSASKSQPAKIVA